MRCCFFLSFIREGGGEEGETWSVVILFVSSISSLMTKRGNGDDVVSVDEEENGGSEKEATTTQAVQVAVNIRPLIAMERVQGCSDCIAIVPGEPQVSGQKNNFGKGKSSTPKKDLSVWTRIS